MISDAEIKKHTPANDYNYSYSQSNEVVHGLIERLRSAEAALKLVDEYGLSNYDESEAYDRGMKVVINRTKAYARAHFEKLN